MNNKSNKQLHIGKPNIEFNVNSLGTIFNSKVTRISCNVNIQENNPSCKTIWFEVDPQYGDMLCTDVCDPYVVGLLIYCLKNGLDITSDLPMSEELYYNIVDYLIPALVKTDSRLKDITISCQLQSYSEIENTEKNKAVGTSISCGVDSLHSIYKYYNHPSSEFRLTHVCLNNVGAFNGIYGVKEKIDAVRLKQYQRSRNAANDLNLPLIETDSNFADVLIQNHLLTHTYSSMFAVFMLSSLWGKYYYPSSGHDYTKFNIKDNSIHDSADYEILTLNFLSTKKLKIYSEGADCTRVQKIQQIADFKIAQRYLYSCTALPENCGKCEKCLRNLYTLDAISKLDQFKNVYNVSDYLANQKMYLMQLINRKDAYAQDMNQLFIEKNHLVYQNCLKVNTDLEVALNSFKNNIEKTKQIQTIEKYADYSEKALLTLYHYYTEKSTDEERQKGFNYLQKAFDFGNPDALIMMIDYLSCSSKSNEKKKAFELCTRIANAGGPRAQYRLGKMYLDGKIVPKDRNLALKWLRSASLKNNPEAHIEFIDLLMSGDNPQEWKEAFELCTRIANAGGPRAQHRLAKYYLTGKGGLVDTNQSYKYLKLALSHGDRINWFTDYIFTLRSTILMNSPTILKTQKDLLVNLYFTLLEEHGCWIGLKTVFQDIPIFPHGLMSIFISDSAKIGKNCTIYQQVTIGSNKIENHPKKGAPIVGNNVLIGAGAQIIGNVKIGDNVKIGAGSTVAQNIANGATVVPAIRILER